MSFIKHYEGIGALIGSIAGAVSACVILMLTESYFSAVLAPLGFGIGQAIGKAIDKRKSAS